MRTKHPLADALADPALLDLIPCRMRISRSTLSTPVPRGQNRPNINSDLLVWCECMAATLDQRLWASRGAKGPAPRVRGPRPCDYLAIVSVHDGYNTARQIFVEHQQQRHA